VDLRLDDRTIWIVSASVEVARQFAAALLAEGARCAIFCAGVGPWLIPLRTRHGFRVFSRPYEVGAASDVRRAAVQWGGPPSGFIVHLPDTLTPPEVEDWLAPLVADAATNASIVLLRDPGGALASHIDTEALHAQLRTEVSAVHRIAPDGSRVSALGCLLGPAGGPARHSRLSDDAAISLAMFLLARGAPQVLVVGPEGLIEVG
jgi:hypothetical protein